MGENESETNGGEATADFERLPSDGARPCPRVGEEAADVAGRADGRPGEGLRINREDLPGVPPVEDCRGGVFDANDAPRKIGQRPEGGLRPTHIRGGECDAGNAPADVEGERAEMGWSQKWRRQK